MRLYILQDGYSVVPTHTGINDKPYNAPFAERWLPSWIEGIGVVADPTPELTALVAEDE